MGGTMITLLFQDENIGRPPIKSSEITPAGAKTRLSVECAGLLHRLHQRVAPRGAEVVVQEIQGPETRRPGDGRTALASCGTAVKAPPRGGTLLERGYLIWGGCFTWGGGFKKIMK